MIGKRFRRHQLWRHRFSYAAPWHSKSTIGGNGNANYCPLGKVRIIAVCVFWTIYSRFSANRDAMPIVRSITKFGSVNDDEWYRVLPETQILLCQAGSQSFDRPSAYRAFPSRCDLRTWKER